MSYSEKNKGTKPIEELSKEELIILANRLNEENISLSEKLKTSKEEQSSLVNQSFRINRKIELIKYITDSL